MTYENGKHTIRITSLANRHIIAIIIINIIYNDNNIVIIRSPCYSTALRALQRLRDFGQVAVWHSRATLEEFPPVPPVTEPRPWKCAVPKERQQLAVVLTPCKQSPALGVGECVITSRNNNTRARSCFTTGINCEFKAPYENTQMTTSCRRHGSEGIDTYKLPEWKVRKSLRQLDVWRDLWKSSALAPSACLEPVCFSR